MAQQPVAGQAKRVVDRAEVVEIDHHDAERNALGHVALEPLLERAVVVEPGQVVRACLDLDRPVDLGVLKRDRDLGREELHELELVLGERRPDAQSLEGQHPVAPSPAQGTTIRQPSCTSPSRKVFTRIAPLVRDVQRLVVLDDPCRHARLALLPWLEVVVGMDATGGQWVSTRLIEYLDRDVVACDEAAQPIGDALEDGLSKVVSIDLGDLQQRTLASRLALVRGRLGLQALGGVCVGHRLGGEARVDLRGGGGHRR